MKKILVGLIGIFILGVVAGMVGMIAGLFVGNLKMAIVGAFAVVMSFFLIAVLPAVADVIEEYFF